MEPTFSPETASVVMSVTFDVTAELASAMARYPAMNSAHEGYAVILEELDELWEEVRKKPSERSRDAMHAEAIQVAAMAMRFIINVCREYKPVESEAVWRARA